MAGQIVDAAQFLVEPPDLWTSGLPEKLRDGAPRVVDAPGGGQLWSFAGGAWLRPLAFDAGAGAAPQANGGERSYPELRASAYDAGERLVDMAADGIDVACMYPTFGMELRFLTDPELQVACVRAYNDYAAAWAATDPGRLVPLALMPNVGLDAAINELERVAAAGFRGLVFTGWPSGAIEPSPDDDRFWARCQEAGLVVSLLHGGPGAERKPTVASRYAGDLDAVRVSDLPQALAWTQAASTNNLDLTHLVLTGILDRFPALTIVVAEAGAGWLPTCGELLDWNYRYAQFLAFAKLRLRPSDYIRRQVHVTLRGEPSTVAARHDVGVGSLLWSSGFPTSTTSWPRSAAERDELFAGIPADDVERMSGGSCTALYGLGIPVTARA